MSPALNPKTFASEAAVQASKQPPGYTKSKEGNDPHASSCQFKHLATRTLRQQYRQASSPPVIPTVKRGGIPVSPALNPLAPCVSCCQFKHLATRTLRQQYRQASSPPVIPTVKRGGIPVSPALNPLAPCVSCCQFKHLATRTLRQQYRQASSPSPVPPLPPRLYQQ